MIERKYVFVALTPKGLGEACKLEIEQIARQFPEAGIENIQARSSGVACRANPAAVVYLNLLLRTASRILLELVAGKAVSGDEDVRSVVMTSGLVGNWMDLHQSFSIDAAVRGMTDLSQRYFTLLVKDGVCDAFREAQGDRPSVARERPDIQIFALCNEGRMWLSLDTSGDSLHLRGYRNSATGRNSHEAPMKENLAAGILALAGWQEFCWHTQEAIRSHNLSQSNHPFRWERPGALPSKIVAHDTAESLRRIPAGLDASGAIEIPMCGSGTLAIEAARMLADIPTTRPWQSWGFSRLAGLVHLQGMFEAADSVLAQRVLSSDAIKAYLGAPALGTNQEGPIHASDVDPDSCTQTLEGARRSGVEDFIAINHKDFVQSQRTGPGSLVILNPPYGVRMKTGETINYKFIGDTLKQRYPESVAWIISADPGALKTVGLRPTRKHIVYNGALECQLSQYVISGPKKLENALQNPASDEPGHQSAWNP